MGTDKKPMTLNTAMNIAALIIVLVAVLIVYRSCTKPPDVVSETREVLVVDSVAVQTLFARLAQMQNDLNAKPKVIVVTKTIHDSTTVTDTLNVYPVGSKALKRDYPFTVAAGKDSISLNVNTDLYTYVYTDSFNNFYHEDSLRVWLTDLRVYKHTPIVPVRSKSSIYIMGGAGAARYTQMVAGQTLVQTDLQPNLGVGYMRGAWGAYVLGAPNGASIGATVNLSEIYRGMFK